MGRSLQALGVSRTAYYRWRRWSEAPQDACEAPRPRPPQAVLPAERDAVIAYALKEPNPRHRRKEANLGITQRTVCFEAAVSEGQAQTFS